MLGDDYKKYFKWVGTKEEQKERSNNRKAGIKIDNYERNTHDFVRSSLVAGRAECFYKCKAGRAEFNPTITTTGINIVDFWSLYPSALGFAGEDW